VKELAEGMQSKAISTEAQLEADVSALRTAPVVPAPASSAEPPAVLPSGWNSAIAPDFPKLFEAFMKKQFTLLCPGSRDGFGCWDFHRRCDWHPSTLTVILDTKGNIFGGFTPVVGIHELVQARSECEGFHFHAEASAQRPGAEICVEGRREGSGNLLV
jgi:hypothetical protein